MRPEQKGLLRRKWFITFLSVCLIIPGLGTAAFADGLSDTSLCEHHSVHTADCGYQESLPGSPCGHRHTDSCYETNCTHKHDENCGGMEMEDASSCTHQCSEEIGCVTLACSHKAGGHDDSCGYIEAVEGTPCNFECTICSESELDSVAADDTDVDTVTWNNDTVAVIQKSDGTYAQYATLQEAIWAVRRGETATIKIVKDITLSKSVSILTERNITLISDGKHTITAAQTAFSITNSAQYPGPSSLTIGTANDSENELMIIAGDKTTQLIYCKGGTFTFNSGTLDGTDAARGVYLDSGSEFVMNGGKIENCSCANNGGAVMMNSGSTFEMHGGMISNCKAALGGAVFVNEKSGFVMSSGLITQCEATSNGGGIYLGNGEKASFVMNDGAITECTTEYGGGGIHMGNGSNFTMSDGTVSSCASNQGGGIYMRDGANASFTMENGAITQCTAKYDGSGVYMGDNNAFIMNNGSISNCGWIKGATSSRDGGGIYVKGENSSVIMNGGTISNCSAPDHYGGGIFANGANVTIKGTISGCAAKFGGGISSTGKLNIDRGIVEYCKAATRGGGIYLTETATLEMDNAEISGCEAGDGGGVYLATGTKLSLLNESTISGCRAISYESADATWGSGGGIYLSTGTTFTMKNSDIKDNITGYLGGGIYIAGDGTYTLTSGNISGNKTVDQYGYGGGIYVHKWATLNLINVVITKNAATALGGGIWSCRTGDVKIYVTEGGAVFDNDAKESVESTAKTPDQAGDDIASTVIEPAVGFLQLSYHMLGGGANRYYVDGGITGFDAPDGRSAGEGLGAPDGKTARYNAAASSLVTDTYITDAIALKNVVSEEAKTVANGAAKLVISGNSASRGGGVGTNGNLIIGTPDPDSETGNLTVKKEVAGNDQETGKAFSIQVTLKNADGTAADITGEYGEMTFAAGVAVVSLKAGQSITAAGLPTGIDYTVEETAESQKGYTVTYNNQTGTITNDDTIIATVQNSKSSGGITPNFTSVTVKKIWKLDDGGKAADSVKIALLKNRVVDETVTLNKANNWTHTWTGLDLGKIWTVQELDVPEGFDSIISSIGTHFTITNDDKPGSPDDPNKPDDPDNPDKPDNPTKPDKPTKPNKPSKPDPSMVPDEPMIPGSSSGSGGSASGTPQTGDSANAAPWLVVMGLSAAGLTVLFLSKRKKAESNVD